MSKVHPALKSSLYKEAAKYMKMGIPFVAISKLPFKRPDGSDEIYKDFEPGRCIYTPRDLRWYFKMQYELQVPVVAVETA